MMGQFKRNLVPGRAIVTCGYIKSPKKPVAEIWAVISVN